MAEHINPYYENVMERFRGYGPSVDMLSELAASATAEGRLRNLAVSRQLHGMAAVDVCGDARSGAFMDKTTTFMVRSIASGLDPNRAPYLYGHKSIAYILVATHFDGVVWNVLKDAEPGLNEVPGCGGREGFKKVNGQNLHEDEKGLTGYLKRIGSSDPIRLASEKAKKIAAVVPNKPVYAATIDHRSAHLRVFEAHVGQGVGSSQERVLSAIPDSNYTAEGTYTSAQMPELNPHRLPEYLAEQLQLINESNARQREFLFDLISDFSDYTEVQDPQILWISPYPTSMRNRLPILGDVPNNIFKLLPPVIKSGADQRMLDQQVVLDQAVYPLSHSIASRKKKPGAFEHLNTIVIEGHSAEESEHMARALLTLDETKEWMGFTGNKIVVGHVVPKSGNLVGLKQI